MVNWFTFIESGLKDAFIEEIQHSIDKTKGDCPDILRNEKCLCLTTSKVRLLSYILSRTNIFFFTLYIFSLNL